MSWVELSEVDGWNYGTYSSWSWAGANAKCHLILMVTIMLEWNEYENESRLGSRSKLHKLEWNGMGTRLQMAIFIFDINWDLTPSIPLRFLLGLIRWHVYSVYNWLFRTGNRFHTKIELRLTFLDWIGLDGLGAKYEMDYVMLRNNRKLIYSSQLKCQQLKNKGENVEQERKTKGKPT